jgi:hypothetical protein
MPTFNPGSSHTANLSLTVKPTGMSCMAELWLSPDGSTKAATSGLVAFTATGAAQNVTLPVVMPTIQATYTVYLDVYSSGIHIGSYVGTDPVIIVTSPPPSGLWLPTPAAPIHWQWQLSDPLNAATDLIPGVTVYDIDMFDNDASVVAYLHSLGFVVIAYVEAGDWASQRPDASEFPASVLGNNISGWNERWLDIRSPTVRQIIAARFDLAQSKGFDAIEPDCIDGYENNTGFPLTYADQIDFNTWIANYCHSIGMSVGLKGDVDQALDLQPYFDWSLNEQCYQYSECGNLAAFINNNKAVFNCEYRKGTAQCPTMISMHINSMTRDQNLVGPISSGYLRTPCIPDTQNHW